MSKGDPRFRRDDRLGLKAYITVMDHNFNDRTRDIFRLIVDEYLSTGDPVGSRTLSRRFDAGLSPATIRNVMSDLEEMGYIFSPHTSAGRLPTQSGLRLYVDGLMQVGGLTKDERRTIEVECNASGRSITEVYDKASTMLSGLAGAAAMVIAPKMNKPIRQIQFVQIERTKALVILVMQDGVVENRIIDIPVDLDGSVLQQATNYLNSRMAGRTLQEVRDEILFDIRNHQTNLDQISSRLVEQGLIVAVSPLDGGNIVVRGQSHLLKDVKELENLEQARQLLTILEEEKSMLKMLDSVGQGDGVQIFIGSENRFFDKPNWSSVFSPYRSEDGRIIGAVGVIGPTRLNYARIVAMVDFTSQIMGKLLTVNTPKVK